MDVKVQAGTRAFIVDNAPTHQQEDANSWASRIGGFGSILGYLSGYVDLPKLTRGFLGDTQFKVLCVIGAFSLLSTVLVSVLYIKERNPRLEKHQPGQNGNGVFSFFRQVLNSLRRLPPQIRKVCEVQLCAWCGWFVFLFYITTYVGQIAVNPYFAANPNLTPNEIDDAWENATRVGTFTLLIFAITSFLANILLPLVVVPSYQPPRDAFEAKPLIRSSNPPYRSHAATSAGRSSADAAATPASSSFYAGPRPEPVQPQSTGFLSKCQIPWLTLRRAWLFSHLLFALCMFATFFVYSVPAATVLVGLVGIPMALTNWAPFALISAEISRRDTDARHRGRTDPGDQAQAGVVLGLHNVAVSAPQMFSTLVSSAIFKIAQKPRGSAGDNSVAWVLRYGGLAALAAAVMAYRVDEQGGTAGGEEKEEEGSARLQR